MPENKRVIMIVAGEASGDAHAAKLVKALRDAAPETAFELFGAGGRRMREAGVETLVNADDLAIVGLPEIARALPMFWETFRTLKREALKRKADAAILVDFPDFNLKLAKSLKKQGVKVIYYIAPQLWAWRKHRVKTIKNAVDLLLTILPFEKDWFQKHGVLKVEYVGSPLVREVFSRASKEEFCAKHNLDPSKPIVALLPGSRGKEIARILPVMTEAAAVMTRENADLQFVVALLSAPPAFADPTSRPSADAGGSDMIVFVQNETYDALNAADAAAVTSGTATLEAAILGAPMAIVYKTSALNYALLRPLIGVEHFGLINLIAGERLVKEFIQDDLTPKILAEELFRLLEPETNKKMRENLKAAAETLGHGGASKRAADAILKEISHELHE